MAKIKPGQPFNRYLKFYCNFPFSHPSYSQLWCLIML